MRNPCRFGGRWSFCPITMGEPYWANGVAHLAVSARIRRWHPAFWGLVLGYALKHVRLRIAIGRAR